MSDQSSYRWMTLLRPTLLLMYLMVLLCRDTVRSANAQTSEELEYDPLSWPPNCCSYQLSGTSGEADPFQFPPLPLLLFPPTDPIHDNNTYLPPRVVASSDPKKKKDDRCSGSTMKIWQPRRWTDLSDQGIMPNTWFRRYEPDGITRIQGPVYIQDNVIWTKPAPIALRLLLSSRLVQIDLECRTLNQPGPPKQDCIQLWINTIVPSWRNFPGAGCSHESSSGSSSGFSSGSSSGSSSGPSIEQPTPNSSSIKSYYLFSLLLLSIITALFM